MDYRLLFLPLAIGLAFGAVRWIQRTAADLRGHRLPPMRWL